MNLPKIEQFLTDLAALIVFVVPLAYGVYQKIMAKVAAMHSETLSKIAATETQVAVAQNQLANNSDRLNRQGANLQALTLAATPALPPPALSAPLSSTGTVLNDTSSSNQTNIGSGVMDGTSA